MSVGSPTHWLSHLDSQSTVTYCGKDVEEWWLRSVDSTRLIQQISQADIGSIVKQISCGNDNQSSLRNSNVLDWCYINFHYGVNEFDYTETNPQTLWTQKVLD